MPYSSDLERRIVRDGLRAPDPPVRFADLSPELQAAVDAYDLARRTSYGRKGEPPMSDANKASIAPFIAAAVAAYLQISPRRVA
jgi:hypothetical protein